MPRPDASDPRLDFFCVHFLFSPRVGALSAHNVHAFVRMPKEALFEPVPKAFPPSAPRLLQAMEHSLPLISTLVIAFSLALVFGFLVERFLKAPALVGYLLAGIAAGQHTPGVFADPELAHQLSEIGVMLLMFGVGLHFSIQDLMRVKKIAIPGAILQMLGATALGAVAAHVIFGRHWVEAFALGLSLSCASTVVLLKALEVRGILSGPDGRIAVGWLVVEDLATVIILVLLPPLANVFGSGAEDRGALDGFALAQSLGLTLALAALFVVLMLLVGRRILPWAIKEVAKTRSRELFTLFVLAAAVGIAYGAAVFFHVSFALGAFFAGMVMQESRFAHRAATESLPLQDAFAVLFFVAVGMLFDWRVLTTHFGEVLAVLVTIVLGKSLCAFLLVWLLRYPLHTALTVAVSLAQIGEFSFILVAQAVQLGLASPELVNLVVAGAILSIALNPICFSLVPKVAALLTAKFAWAARASQREMPGESEEKAAKAPKPYGHWVVVGSGTLARSLSERLASEGRATLLTGDAEASHAESVEGLAVLEGDAAHPALWESAHPERAAGVVFVDEGAATAAAAAACRELAPKVPLVFVGSDAEAWSEAHLENSRFLSIERSAVDRLAASIVEPESSAASEEADEVDAPAGH